MTKKNKEDKILLLKISDATNIPFGDPEKLRQRASGAWKISIEKIWDVKKVLLLFQQQIIAEYDLGDTIQVDRGSHRLTFDLTPVNNSELQNCPIRARTSNPASTLDIKDLQTRLDEGKEDADRRQKAKESKNNY